MKNVVPVACLVLTLLGAGCSATYELRMEPRREPDPRSAVSPLFQAGKYRRVMVVSPRPSGSETYPVEAAAIERELMREGIGIISASVTGRVVYDAKPGGPTRVEGATPLSDAERVLIMGKDSGADAILEVASFGWMEEETSGRYFVLDPAVSPTRYQEVPRAEYEDWGGARLRYAAPEMRIVGRLVDVESGEVVISLDVRSAANWNLPAPYEVSFTRDDADSIQVLWESFRYADGRWRAEARELTFRSVVAAVAEAIAGRSGPEPAPSAPPAPSPPVTGG